MGISGNVDLCTSLPLQQLLQRHNSSSFVQQFILQCHGTMKKEDFTHPYVPAEGAVIAVGSGSLQQRVVLTSVTQNFELVGQMLDALKLSCSEKTHVGLLSKFGDNIKELELPLGVK